MPKSKNLSKVLRDLDLPNARAARPDFKPALERTFRSLISAVVDPGADGPVGLPAGLVVARRVADVLVLDNSGELTTPMIEQLVAGGFRVVFEPYGRRARRIARREV